MRRSLARKLFRFAWAALWPSAFLVWAVRFVDAVANPVIHAFGEVDQQIAQVRAELLGDAVWGALLLAMWVGTWSLTLSRRSAKKARRQGPSGLPAGERQNFPM